MNETVLERFPRWVFGEFYRSAKYVRNFPRSTHMFICWRARKRRTGMKAQASCPNKELELNRLVGISLVYSSKSTGRNQFIRLNRLVGIRSPIVGGGGVGLKMERPKKDSRSKENNPVLKISELLG